MRTTHVAPGALLAPFVRAFTFVEARHETTRTLIPDAAITIGFRYAGSATLVEPGSQIRVPDASFAGLRSRARTMRTSAGGGVLLVRFREAGAAAFFRAPLHEVFGATLALDDFVPAAKLGQVMEQVAAATTDAARVALVEQFLLARLHGAESDHLVLRTLRAIRAAPGAVRVGRLAHDFGISRDRLEKRFRRVVGASPKQLATIHRLHQAVGSYEPGANLAQLSVASGYCDQSHFNREFRAATGQAPRQFLRAGAYC